MKHVPYKCATLALVVILVVNAAPTVIVLDISAQHSSKIAMDIHNILEPQETIIRMYVHSTHCVVGKLISF